MLERGKRRHGEGERGSGLAGQGVCELSSVCIGFPTVDETTVKQTCLRQ